MADATLKSTQMIVGVTENVSSLALMPDMGPDDFYNKLKALIESNPIKNVIIVTDIIGGTPFNQSFRVNAEIGLSGLISGLCLPLVIQLETLYAEEQTTDFIPALLEEVKESITSVGGGTVSDSGDE